MKVGAKGGETACVAAVLLLLLACEPTGSPPSASADSETIRGVVRLAPGEQAPATGTLFVIARGPGSGPPLAVQRLALGPFPVAFEIGPSDAPHPGTRFEGPIFLGARVDADGDVATRERDGLGASGVELVLVPNAHPAQDETQPR